jgi:hypothetical protein
LDPTLVTMHSATLTGLLANQQYQDQVMARDAAGLLTVSPNFKFKTHR